MTFPLSDENLRRLYARYEAPPEWARTLRGAIEWFVALSPAAKREPANQEALWRIRGVGGVGPGSGVPITPAFDDAAIVERLLALPERVADMAPPRIPGFLQGEYDELLAMVTERTDDNRRPMAMLSRAFVVLVPRHVHTVFPYRANRELGRRLLRERPDGQMALRVAVRRRLRAVLGDEADLDEHIRRITFCWWLATEDASELLAASPASSPSVVQGAEDQPEPLKLWPFTKQLKGYTAAKGYGETYRTVVLAAAGGASVDDIVSALEELPEFESARKTLRQIVGRVRRLGFLETRGGVLWPTEDGEELVEYDPPDILAEKLLVQVYGMAQAVRVLKDGPVHRTEMYQSLRAEYLNWKTDMAPKAMLSWLRSIGLVTKEQGDYWLTEAGRVWEQRLPDDLPRPPAGFFDEPEDEADDASPAAPRSSREPSAREMRERLATDPSLRDFVLDEGQLPSLHAAWHGNPSKRFAIFSGLSGTGKTALMRHYAHAYCALCGVDPENHVALVAVSPDWRDPTGLLGYFNALHADPTYQAEPATRLLVRAARNPELPYFLLLDEMNLARVERYLAPLLSAMETGDPIWLHAHDETVNGVPPRVRWPKRLFIGGTVNMDESTHGFSDKVLDRAFTLEFWDVDLPAYLEKRAATRSARVPAAEAALMALHDALVPIRRHFGYRAANEVLLFVEQAVADGLIGPGDALDRAIFSKVLPRLRGTDLDGFDDALRSIGKLLRQRGLSRSAGKVDAMVKALERTGVTKFFA